MDLYLAMDAICIFQMNVITTKILGPIFRRLTITKGRTNMLIIKTAIESFQEQSKAEVLEWFSTKYLEWSIIDHNQLFLSIQFL